MTDTTQQQTVTKKTRRAKKAGVGTIFLQGIPYIIFGAVLGLIIYNPVFSLVNLIRLVFLEGKGNVSGADGSQLPFYFQPANIGLVLAIVIVAVILYFKWEVARNEKKFMFAVLVLWVLANMLILGVWQMFAENPFSRTWVEWQAPAALMSALTFGMYIPKIRRAASGTMTAGGGSFDEITTVTDGDDSSDDD